jgi:hypothetical protein
MEKCIEFDVSPSGGKNLFKAWGARGRRFESFHTDHMNQGLRVEML